MEEFTGTARFSLVRQLGSGGFGTVYEALDNERGAVVALKVLAEQWGESLYLFKQEFRSLADLSHRNLATLFELFNEGPHWFFTMELLRGQDFLAQACEESGTPTHTPTRTTTSSELRANTEEADLPEPIPAGHRPLLQEGALCDLLLQITEGLLYLHGAGKLHRDLKPANVLCCEDGRAVILDFGLAMEITDAEANAQIIGTPTYMSPEQAAGAAVGPATDWYSFGVMLFQALIGRPPFLGTGGQVLRQKQECEAPRLSSKVSEIAADWDQLCADLLRQNPEERLVGEEVRTRLLEIRARLGGAGEQVLPSYEEPAKEPTLVGRQKEQAALNAAYEEALRGHTVVAVVHGISGMGKSALCRQFLHRLEKEAKPAIVLTGRCYQHEQVPFKALDGVIDTLSRSLKRLPRERARELLPRDIAMLCQLFPVLRRVPAVEEAQGRPIEDPRERKRAAFVALRELFQRLAAMQPVVMYIDDLQWGDLDSVALILEVLHAPDAPALLLLLAHRSEDQEGEVVAALRETLRGELYRAVTMREVEVGGLDTDEARQLLRSLLTDSDFEAVEAMVKEAGGNPLFLQELAQDVRPDSSGEHLTLAQTIRRRVQRLPEEAQRLLEVVCVAGHPLTRTAAGQAVSGLLHEPQALTQLRVGHLLRVRGSGKREEFVPYHDRIRESVATGLAVERRRGIHLQLAEALERFPEKRQAVTDSQQVMHHYLEAGELERAAPHAIKAAAQARAALAFDQAARLCEQALALPGLSPDQTRTLRAQLAEALACAGQSYKAGQAYLQAAADEPKQEALEHRHQAMSQFLGSGYGEEGRQVLLQLVRDVGLPAPAGKLWTILVALLWFYIWLPLRGRGFRERTEREIAPDELLRIDTCGYAATYIRLFGHRPQHWSIWYTFWFGWLAFRAGEPGRISSALKLEGFVAAMAVNREKGDRLLKLANAAAERSQNPYYLDSLVQVAGLVSFHAGEWVQACNHLKRSDTLLQQYPHAAAERAAGRFYHLASLWGQGAVEPFTKAAATLLKEAQEQGQLYLTATIQAYFSGTYLVSDQPSLAWNTVEKIRKDHSENFTILGIVARIEPGILLYQGHWTDAWELTRRRWKECAAAGVLIYRQTRVILRSGQAQAALALFAQGREDKRWLRRAARQIAAIAREHGLWPAALSLALRASLARLRGDHDLALRLLQEAAQRFTQADMALHAAAAQRRRGEWTGDKALIEETAAFMSTQGIKSPERMIDMLMPV